MITAYSLAGDLLQKLDCSPASGAALDGLAGATWIDLLDPSAEQERAVERALSIAIPTQGEVRTVDASSQIYRDGETLVMSARVLSRSAAPEIRLVAVTFLLTRHRLVTLRYGDPTPFATFVARAEKEPGRSQSGETVMLGLLEAIIDRAAEILQSAGDALETLSSDIFSRGDQARQAGRRDLHQVLQEVGRAGDLATRVRESLHGLGRIVPYLRADKGVDGEMATRLDIAGRDIASLLEHDAALMNNVTFLLDATLGLISIQQNGIIKILSVASVVFLPPTLLASIWGMNFVNIPELHYQYSYFVALGVMLLSAVLPYLFFKRRGWL